MIDDEDINPEIIIAENDDPLKIILNQLKLLSEEYGFGNVKFRIECIDDNFTNLYEIEIPENMSDSEISDGSFYINDKIYNFCKDNNLLKSLEYAEIRFI